MEKSSKEQRLKKKQEEFNKKYERWVKTILISTIALIISLLAAPKEGFKNYLWISIFLFMVVITAFLIPVIKTMMEHKKIREEK